MSELIATITADHRALRDRVNGHDERLDKHEQRITGHDIQFARMLGYAGGVAGVLTVILHYLDKLWKS